MVTCQRSKVLPPPSAAHTKGFPLNTFTRLTSCSLNPEPKCIVMGFNGVHRFVFTSLCEGPAALRLFAGPWHLLGNLAVGVVLDDSSGDCHLSILFQVGEAPVLRKSDS